MKNAVWRGKKVMKRWQAEKNFDSHVQRLRQMRPVSCDFEWQPPTLNQNKKFMIQQDKFTQIQRQNRYLLQKITSTMRKKDKDLQKEKERERMNRSLNGPFRKRQMQTIEVENAKMLRRLQQKKSDYDSSRLKQEWKKQKQVIKNVACYPFILRTSFRHPKKRTFSKQQQSDTIRTGATLSGDIEMVRARTIDNEQFIITVRLQDEYLKIVGIQRSTKDKKIINVPRQEAMAFIEEECSGRLEGIFDRLLFDSKKGILYLMGSGGDLTLVTIQEKKSILEDQKVVEN